MGAYRYSGAKITLWIAFAFLLPLSLRAEVRAAQTAVSAPPARQEAIGRLSGDDVSVNGAISFDNENGRTTAVLASGSDLTLRSGQAKIDLAVGGDIILCGPARLSIVKSGPAITIALDYGQVHLQIGATAQVNIYTPLLVATPVAIGDRGLDLTVGLDEKGELCAAAFSGAMRVKEQFTGQSLIVPQGGDIQIEGGELSALHSSLRKCSCELLVSQNDPRKQIELSVPAHPSPNGPSNASAPEPASPPSYHEPTYRIDMPPLTFNASSPSPPPSPNPEAMLIIRESIADPRISFRGAVKPALPALLTVTRPASQNPKRGFLARLLGIFHRHKAPLPEHSASD